MKKIVFALIALSAGSLALADAPAKEKSKCDASCTKECCNKEKSCTDAKNCSMADSKKDEKATDKAVEKK